MASQEQQHKTRDAAKDTELQQLNSVVCTLKAEAEALQDRLTETEATAAQQAMETEAVKELLAEREAEVSRTREDLETAEAHGIVQGVFS